MKKLAILGLGHIGSYVLNILSQDENFNVQGYDLSTGHDLSKSEVLVDIISNVDGVLASTPFYLNKQIALICDQLGVDYFDLTESVDVTNMVKNLKNAKFVTQCGLAPGMVSIIANELAKKFEQVQDIEIRVGALPINANNHMLYYRTWSTEGLVNEYIHQCPILKSGYLLSADPLGEQENVSVNGINLEACTTSGGLGSLAETYVGKARNVNYKTLRYPGHWSHMRFLKDDLGLANNFDVFVEILNKQIPITRQDCVYILINVSGFISGTLHTEQYSKVIYFNQLTTAIQLTTGSGVMAVLDVWNQGLLDSQQGWIKQEDINFAGIWNSKYSNCYH